MRAAGTKLRTPRGWCLLQGQGLVSGTPHQRRLQPCTPLHRAEQSPLSYNVAITAQGLVLPAKPEAGQRDPAPEPLSDLHSSAAGPNEADHSGLPSLSREADATAQDAPYSGTGAPEEASQAGPYAHSCPRKLGALTVIEHT